MLKTKRTLIGVMAVATAALAALAVSPAQAASSNNNQSSGKDQALGAASPLSDNLAPDRAAVAKPASHAAEAAVRTIQARIARYVAAHGTTYTFATYLDGTTGKIVVDTNAPAGVLGPLTDLASASVDEQQASSQIQVRRNTIDDNFSRRDDVPPYYGGGGIASGGGICSSGYAVRNAAGTVFMSTAGHCFAVGATVLTESGAHTYGTVSNRHLPTITGEPRDGELIGGQSYAGRIFTGGVTSSSSAPVVAAGTAYVGYNNYCHSGRTTGENCGHTATSISGQVCTATGCKSPVIVWTGGTLSQGGDSGSPFYAKDANGGVWIRGHVIAGGGGNSYSEPWTSIAPVWGVSIVTG
jgi:hypothetical protein